MASAYASGKGSFICARTKIYLTHMSILEGMACTNIRFGMTWLSKPVNSLPYCFLLFVVRGYYTTVGLMAVQIVCWVFSVG